MFGRGNWAVYGLGKDSLETFVTSLEDRAVMVAASQLAASAITRYSSVDTVGINPFSGPRLDEEHPLAPEQEPELAGYSTSEPDERAAHTLSAEILDCEGYGVTECAPVVAVNVPMACRIGSVGQLVPGMRHEIEPLPGIETGGVLHVSGPNVMLGYYLYDQPGVLQPPASRGAGWYSTGDIVQIDDEGFVHIRGRVKRFAKIAGEMISLEVVESIASHACPGITHAATTRSDPARGEALVLYTTAAALGREQLLAAARSLGAPELAVPRQIEQVDAIPLLGSGKIDHVTLRRWAEALARHSATADDDGEDE